MPANPYGPAFDPDGVLDMLSQSQDDFHRQGSYAEVPRRALAPPKSDGVPGPEHAVPAAEPANEPVAGHSAASLPGTDLPAAEMPGTDLAAIDLPGAEVRPTDLGAPAAHALASDDTAAEAIGPDNGDPPASMPGATEVAGEHPGSHAAAGREPPACPTKLAPARKPARRPATPALITPAAPVPWLGNNERARLAQILENVELFPGERAQDYADFAQALDHDLAPRTATDVIFVANFRYLVWELRRVRQWKAELQRGSATAAFVELMEAHLGKLDAAARGKRWRNGHPNSKTRKLMQEAGVTKMSVVAHGVAKHLALIEVLETLDARLDARSRDVLRDFDRQRDAQDRRQSNRPVIDGMFRPADNENDQGDDSSIAR